MVEAMTEVRRQISERLYSPLLGSFLISWSIWNYRFFVILLSDEPVSKSFDLIQQHVFSSPGDYVLNGFIYPLATAGAYIFLYPYPARFVFSFARRRQREILELQRTIENETLLTLEESVYLRVRNQSMRKEFAEQMKEKDAEIEVLKAQLESIRSSVAIVQHQLEPEEPEDVEDSITPSLADMQLRMLEHLEFAGRLSDRGLISIYPDDITRARFVFQELVDKALIEASYSDAGDFAGFVVTHEGRKVILRSRGKHPKKA